MRNLEFQMNRNDFDFESSHFRSKLNHENYITGFSKTTIHPKFSKLSNSPKLQLTQNYISDDHYIYSCEQESLRRNGVPLIIKKRVRNAVLGCNLNNDRMISVHFQGKPLSIAVIQIYAPNTDFEEA